MAVVDVGAAVEAVHQAFHCSQQVSESPKVAFTTGKLPGSSMSVSGAARFSSRSLACVDETDIGSNACSKEHETKRDVNGAIAYDI